MHSHQYYGGSGGGNASSNNGNVSGNGGRKRKVSIRDEDDDDEDDDDDNDHDHDDGGSGTGGGNNGSSQSRGKRALRGISSGAGGGGGGNGGGTGDKDDETRKKGKERPGRGKGMRRGARACTNCRRGKNRCEGDHPCNRCAAQNLECVFAKPPPKVGNSNSNSLQQQFMHIESSVNHLAASQNQMQSTLSQILSALSQNQMNNQHVPQLNYPQHSPSQNDGMGTSQSSLSMQHHASRNMSGADMDEDGFAWPDPPVPKAPIAKMEEDNMEEDVKPKEFPKLPGFKPPPHRYANYGLVVSSTAASSDDESEDTLPRSSLNAPIEALHQLANAADQAAKENAKLEAENRQQGFLSPPRVLQNQLKFKRMKKPDPAPRNAFPDVVTKGLVSPEEARELWDIFFSGCHYFIPVFDPSYDEFESFVQRTPFSFDGMLAVAAKIRAGAGPLGRTHTRCLEEAQGIARSTLFGPVVRKEAVMAVLILASWSQDPWLPSGHALRMGLDMNLHKALEKLGEDVGTFGGGKARTEAEERDLVVSARIWLNCYLNDHTVSLGTGRPLMLRDDESVRNARQLLTHPMASETDVRLVACVELMSHKVRVWTHLHPLRGRIDTTTIDFVRRVSNDLLAWHAEWRTRHLQKHEEESVLVKLLDAELYYAQLWTACVALRGCNWDKLNLDQRELAFGAKDAALKCLSAYKSSSLRHYLKYAVHETMVQASFAAVFLLKIAILFPTQVTAKFISTEVADLANLMSECAAERYALTLRLMLRSFRRKMGETTMAPGTPRTMANGQVAGPSVDGMIPGHRGLESLLSMDGDSAVDFSILDDLGPFNWPEDGFSPSNLPQWITEGNVMDLGLPYDGSDSIFLPPELANMFLPAPTSWQLGDSAETGAEAW
ncbi:hypothetical protein FFLO_05601 [Filobasidium floriforme]|uniref:Zn(2)-C6 fungal-type domain-containing protein n=1 Tax=Filobasidium floriforme TaxID=5210 RepID=A0A8K0NR78_9TREE|nr:hypothetical protein FFLO_05601 [Filobasidium floriforme]